MGAITDHVRALVGDSNHLSLKDFEMKPEETADRELWDVLLVGGYLPSFELCLKLGRDLQNVWMNSYQEVQITNTFKVVLKRTLATS